MAAAYGSSDIKTLGPGSFNRAHPFTDQRKKA
ncbi:hypothetical protein CCACVL1_20484 [Corchorus capsularis]|uniref:Uncharacterized protein n=1 Tax=Corchorus capsularis TaxID=210143 RepID=A0A1R3HB25_COCAP|nr:hypothetical protein CCACVL1_20484 [Corchorus capsularis]